MFNLLYIYANFYINFLIKLLEKGAISSYSYQEIINLSNFINNQQIIDSVTSNIDTIAFSSYDEVKNTDIPILFLLAPILILYSKSGKNLFSYENFLVNLVNNHYKVYREMSERLGLLDLSIDIDNTFINFYSISDTNLLFKEILLLAILDQLSTFSLPVFDSDKFSSIHIRDGYPNFVNTLYNIFSNKAEEVTLVNSVGPNNKTYALSFLDLNIKLINMLIFIQNINRKFQQNSINVKFIFNDTLF